MSCWSMTHRPSLVSTPKTALNAAMNRVFDFNLSSVVSILWLGGEDCWNSP